LIVQCSNAAYYFHFRDGDTFVKDEEGLELLDIAEAQIEAAEFLGNGQRHGNDAGEACRRPSYVR
jgi:hypothetical protein